MKVSEMTEERREFTRQYFRDYRAKNPDKMRAFAKKYNSKRKNAKKEWWEKNKERLNPIKLLKGREHYQKNKTRINSKTREWQKRNRERVRRAQAKFVTANPQRIKEINEKSRLKRMANPFFRLQQNFRGRIAAAIRRNGKKCARTAEILGCSLDDLRRHLQEKFRPGMTWENYGSVWHVDHIMPCAAFDFSKPDHQRRCFHFSNLQPLFAKENIAKRDKITVPQLNLILS